MPDLHSKPIHEELFDGTLNGYQQGFQKTAIYPGRGTFLGLNYCTMKMNGEAGELAEKVGKLMRDEGFIPKIESPHGIVGNLIIAWPELSKEQRESLAKELGDVLWYVAAAAKELNYNLSEIANMNLQKLLDRQRRGTLDGSGDNR